MKPIEREKFAALVEWNRAHGGSLHPAVEIYSDPITKFSLRTKKKGVGSESLAPPAKAPEPSEQASIKSGNVITTCPLSTTLSYLNALTGGPLMSSLEASEGLDLSLSLGRNPAFPAHFMHTVPPHVVGRFFLMQQYLLGERSCWHAYIATLPQPEHPSSWALPAFWTEEDAAFLEGTNAGVAAEEAAARAASEHREARRALRDAGMAEWRDYSAALYRWAFCVFASRSFRPSLVVPTELWDRLLMLAADTEAGESKPQRRDDDFSVLMPLFDIANHDPRVVARWEPSSAPVPGSCLLVAGQAYEPGQQVFNNYGLKTNSELLLGYGFMLPETEALHNDYVHLRLRVGGGGSQSGDAAGRKQDASTAGEQPKPRDFLVSLRPMDHPSSLVGCARQWLTTHGHDGSSSSGRIPDFGHIEDALLWQFVGSHLGPPPHPSEPLSEDGGKTPPATMTAPARLDAVLALPTPPGAEDLVSQLRELLLAKLGTDFERLVNEEPDEAAAMRSEECADASPSSGTANQRLALTYRIQCEQVLINAMMALDPTIRLEVSEREVEEEEERR